MHSLQSWLNRFCLKHPRLSIPGLMRYIVIGNVLVYLLDMFSQGAASNLLCFHSGSILSGQVWRILTFVFVPYTSGIVFFLITLYFYYFIGTALEREWGSNKFTIFYFFGVLLNVLLGFLVGSASMYYVNMSMFFAFATLFPDMQVLFFFVIPMKVKWLAWLDGAYFAYMVVRYLAAGYFLYALIPIVAVLNYLIFFAGDISGQVSQWRQRAKFRSGAGFQRGNPKVVNFHNAKTQTKGNYLHRCAVCGKTDVTDPQMEFRYCSRCNGYYCYCADHINTHIHIQ